MKVAGGICDDRACRARLETMHCATQHARDEGNRVGGERLEDLDVLNSSTLVEYFQEEGASSRACILHYSIHCMLVM